MSGIIQKNKRGYTWGKKNMSRHYSIKNLFRQKPMTSLAQTEHIA